MSVGFPIDAPVDPRVLPVGWTFVWYNAWRDSIDDWYIPWIQCLTHISPATAANQWLQSRFALTVAVLGLGFHLEWIGRARGRTEA